MVPFYEKIFQANFGKEIIIFTGSSKHSKFDHIAYIAYKFESPLVALFG